MLLIIKRDGSVVEFDRAKIENAVLAAFEDVDGKLDDYAKSKADNIKQIKAIMNLRLKKFKTW